MALWLVLAVLGCLALLLVVFSVLADRSMSRAIAEADQLDPGWRLEELEQARAVVPDAENSATLVLAAARELPLPYQVLWGALGDAGRLTPVQQLADQHMERLGVLPAEASKSLEELRALADLPQGRFRFSPPRRMYSFAGTSQQLVIACKAYLEGDVLLRCQAGDWDGALASCRALVNLGRSLGDESLVPSQLTRQATVEAGLRGMSRVLGQGQASEAALAAAQRLLQEDASYPYALQVARAARASCDHELQIVERGDVSLSTFMPYLQSLQQQSGVRVSPAEYYFLRSPGSLRSGRAALLRYTTRLVEIAKLPLPEQAAAYEELEATHGRRPLLARCYAGVIQHTTRASVQFVARERCAIAMLAVERFRLTQGRWPKALDELVPAQLGELPTDPFIEGPLRYCLLEDGVGLFSVGPDREDDGGRRNADPLAQGGGLGFRLWNVDRRRQPAPPGDPMPAGGDQ
jgi:hypothetical protein